MAEDIDDLLNEIEGKLFQNDLKNARKNNQAPRKASSDPSRKKTSVQNNASDTDDFLDELLNDEDLNSHKSTSKHKACQSGTVKTSQSQGSKCFPVFIGGTSCTEGPSTSVSQRACDRLRCTDCDFQVSRFDNMQWHQSVDYLFLRNNMPDFDRLKPKLVNKKGVRAYACQCKWRSAREKTDLKREADLKWVCGGH